MRLEELNSDFDNRIKASETNVLPSFKDIVGEKNDETFGSINSDKNKTKATNGKIKKEDKNLQKNVGSFFLKILNGDFLTHNNSTKQLPFILFLAVVAILYIANGYYAERTVRQINIATKELKELHSEYITTKSTLMQITTQSSIAKLASEQISGLKESKVAPMKIVIEKRKN